MVVIVGACVDAADIDSAPPPTESVPPLTGPLSPVVSCLKERGFDATIDPADGGLAAVYPTDQKEVYREALEECMSGAGLDMDPEKPILSDADYERLLEAYVATAECLAKEGFEASVPPSLQVFIESEGGAWHPYDVMAHDRSLSDTDWQRANRVCPQP